MNTPFFYITQYFTPEPYLKDIDFIKSLKDKGWNPIVITGFPNYPKGKIYSGYKNRICKIEELEGIKVIRTFTYADHSLNPLKRIFNYFCFAFFASYAILKYGKKESVYYVLQSSPFVVIIAWVIKLFKKKSIILLDIQDVFPENIRVSGIINQKWIIRTLDFLLNNFYYRFFDKFITVSQSFNEIIQKKGIENDRILTLYNWSLVENHNEITDIFQFPGDYYNIVYAGNIGVHQGLSLLLPGYKTMGKKFTNVKFHFFGDGTDFKKLKNETEKLNNVILYGRVPSSEILKYLNAADCLFLHLISDPIYECIIPSKLQAYIEVGKPILGGIQGEASDLIKLNNLGEVFNSEDNEGFVDAISKIKDYDFKKINDIKNNSERLYSTEFSRLAGVNKIHNFLRQIVDE